MRLTTTARPQRRRSQGGSVTIEFALAFPVLFAIMFGIIDAGRFIATRTMMAQAAATGARANCLNGATTTTVQTAVKAAAPALSTIAVDWTNSTCFGVCNWPRNQGDIVNLRVQYYFVAGFFTGFKKMMSNDSRIVCAP